MQGICFWGCSAVRHEYLGVQCGKKTVIHFLTMGKDGIKVSFGGTGEIIRSARRSPFFINWSPTLIQSILNFSNLHKISNYITITLTLTSCKFKCKIFLIDKQKQSLSNIIDKKNML